MIEIFLEDPGLWPVLVVLVLVASTLGASLVVLAVQDRRIPAMAALALLVGVTLFGLDSDIRRRSLGRGAKLVISVWVLALAAGLAFSLLVPR